MFGELIQKEGVLTPSEDVFIESLGDSDYPDRLLAAQLHLGMCDELYEMIQSRIPQSLILVNVDVSVLFRSVTSLKSHIKKEEVFDIASTSVNRTIEKAVNLWEDVGMWEYVYHDVLEDLALVGICPKFVRNVMDECDTISRMITDFRLKFDPSSMRAQVQRAHHSVILIGALNTLDARVSELMSAIIAKKPSVFALAALFSSIPLNVHYDVNGQRKIRTVYSNVPTMGWLKYFLTKDDDYCSRNIQTILYSLNPMSEIIHGTFGRFTNGTYLQSYLDKANQTSVWKPLSLTNNTAFSLNKTGAKKYDYRKAGPNLNQYGR